MSDQQSGQQQDGQGEQYGQGQPDPQSGGLPGQDPTQMQQQGGQFDQGMAGATQQQVDSTIGQVAGNVPGGDRFAQQADQQANSAIDNLAQQGQQQAGNIAEDLGQQAQQGGFGGLGG